MKINIKNSDKISLIFFIIPCIVFAWLCIASIAILLGKPIIGIVTSGFLYEAWNILLKNPILVPLMFIIFMGSCTAQGYFTYYEKGRNKDIASIALGISSLFLAIFLYAFWTLNPLIRAVPFVLVSMLGTSYFIFPWKNILIKCIHDNLREAREMIDEYLPIITEIESLINSKLNVHTDVDKFIEKIDKTQKRVEEDNINLQWECSESRELLNQVKSLKNLSGDETRIKDKIKKHIEDFDDKNILNMLLLYYLSNDDLKKLYEITPQESR